MNASPHLRWLGAGLGAVLPASLLAGTFDVLSGFSSDHLQGAGDQVRALLFGVALLALPALLLALAGSQVLAAGAVLWQPRRRLASLLQGVRADESQDRDTAATLLALPLAAGLLVAGSAGTQAVWVSAMANPLFAALATGLLSLIWLVVAAACFAPLQRLLRLVFGLLPARRGLLSLGAVILLGAVALLFALKIVSMVDLDALPLGALATLALLVGSLALLGGLAARAAGPRGLGLLRRPVLVVFQLALLGGLSAGSFALADDSPGTMKALLGGRSLARQLWTVSQQGIAPASGEEAEAEEVATDEPPAPPAASVTIPSGALAAAPAATPGSANATPGAAGDMAAPLPASGTASPPPAAAAASPPTAPTAPPGGPTPWKKPLNFLLILVDTLRADHVGAYGYQRPVTPEIDKLAARSVLFEHCYAQSPHTPRSIPSLLTSRYPSHLDWIKPNNSYPTLKPENLTFAEVLSAGGVHTGLAASHFFFEPKFGAIQGFQDVDNTGATSLPDSNRDTASPRIYARLEPRLARLKEMSDKGQPFLLFVHLFEPHSTYMRHDPPDFFGKGWMDLYDGEIHFSDRYVGKILERLEAVGLAENTAVVLFADHGEGNGEHGFKWHGQHLYNEVTHVPLLIHVPGVTPRRVAEPVALLDLGPTLVELAGLPPVPSFQGRSLQAALLGQPLVEVPIYSQLLSYPGWKEDIFTLVQGRQKLMYNKTNNLWFFYDLAADPGETRDLFEQDRLRARSLQDQLKRWLAEKP